MGVWSIPLNMDDKNISYNLDSWVYNLFWQIIENYNIQAYRCGHFEAHDSWAMKDHFRNKHFQTSKKVLKSQIY